MFPKTYRNSVVAILSAIEVDVIFRVPLISTLCPSYSPVQAAVAVQNNGANALAVRALVPTYVSAKLPVKVPGSTSTLFKYAHELCT